MKVARLLPVAIQSNYYRRRVRSITLILCFNWKVFVDRTNWQRVGLLRRMHFPICVFRLSCANCWNSVEILIRSIESALPERGYRDSHFLFSCLLATRVCFLLLWFLVVVCGCDAGDWVCLVPGCFNWVDFCVVFSGGSTSCGRTRNGHPADISSKTKR